MRKWFPRSLIWSTVILGLLVGPVMQVSASEPNLSAVRHATTKFHDVEVAKAAGYAKLLDCFDLPGVGGMGQHYVNGALVSATATGTVDALHPQAMVYEVDEEGSLELVAVEYIIPYDFVARSAEAPRILGQNFVHNDALRLWVLHAWIFRPNPLGTFINYNPNVEMCPRAED